MLTLDENVQLQARFAQHQADDLARALRAGKIPGMTVDSQVSDLIRVALDALLAQADATPADTYERLAVDLVAKESAWQRRSRRNACPKARKASRARLFA